MWGIIMRLDTNTHASLGLSARSTCISFGIRVPRVINSARPSHSALCSFPASRTEIARGFLSIRWKFGHWVISNQAFGVDQKLYKEWFAETKRLRSTPHPDNFNSVTHNRSISMLGSTFHLMLNICSTNILTEKSGKSISHCFFLQTQTLKLCRPQTDKPPTLDHHQH